MVTTRKAIFIIRQVLSMNGIDNDSPSLNRTIGNNRPRSGLSNPQNTQHITTTEVAVQIPSVLPPVDRTSVHDARTT